MTREQYESLPLSELKEIAKARGMRGTSAMKKGELIMLMLEKDEESRPQKTAEKAQSAAQTERTVQSERSAQTERTAQQEKPVQDMAQLDSGQVAHGILEVLADGYGFIRSANYLPGENDIYINPAMIRKYNLKTGDILCGNVKVRTQTEKFAALLYLKSVNGYRPEEAARRRNFEELTPIFPNERIHLERPGGSTAMRVVDLISPIGKGQRGMIVSPPKAGKTTLLKDVAKSVTKNHPDMQLLILLIDERPEEVTDIKEAIEGPNVEVIYSTFDELPDHHRRVAEMVIERAKRLVEHKKDVIILLDSITRLARAYNLTVPPADGHCPVVLIRQRSICPSDSLVRPEICGKAEV